MSARYFLDTNVFVYAFDRKTPAKAKRAMELIRRAVESGRGIVSYQVVQEFVNVALRRFEQPLSAAEAEPYLLLVFKPLLAVESSPQFYLEALRVFERHRLGWHDSLIVASAIAGGCTILYTEDLQTERQVEGVRIQNPFAG